MNAAFGGALALNTQKFTGLAEETTTNLRRRIAETKGGLFMAELVRVCHSVHGAANAIMALGVASGFFAEEGLDVI